MIHKRLFDIFSSLIGLLIALPIFLTISLLMLMSFDSGPLFFKQYRVGINRKLFKLYKFRTMRVASNAEKGRFDIGDKSRITSLGRILRKTKLDELPQLINVLKGEMSIVGPRPEVQQWTEIYSETWDIVLRLKPGITDNASIHFRNEEEILSLSNNPKETYKTIILPIKLEYYLEYVNNHSVYGDIIIIFKTFKQIIFK